MQYKLFRMFFVLTFVFGLATMSTPQPARAAGPWYVSTTGNDANDCMSPTTPCASVNGAIGKASAGDTINVAIGTYAGAGNEVVLLDKDAALSGGWDETFAAQSSMSSIDGQGTRLGVMVNSGVTVAVERFTVQNSLRGINNSGTLTLNNSIVSSNTSDWGSSGGGILNIGTIILNNSTVIGNNAGYGANGGGIFNNGSMTLNNSTVSGNTGTTAYWTGLGGGGIYNGSTLTLNNSTVSSNMSRGYGGGIFNNGTTTLNNSTVSGNTGNMDYYNGFGGGIFNYSGALTLKNTLVAGNSATNSGPDCYGSIGSAGYNLIGNTSDCTFATTTGDLTNIDPLLGPLQDNGGAAFTHALLPGSSAIDAGNPTGCTNQDGNPLTVDQRGVTRPQGVRCDIGAFELEGGVGTAPINDNFTNSEVITSLPFSTTVDNSWAGIEPGETQACYNSQKTVWYSFIPATDGAVRVDMASSGFSNTMISIYKSVGSGIGGLNFLTCAVYTGNSATFTVQAGETYYIRAGGIDYAAGDLHLNFQTAFPPTNDNFANASLISTLPFNGVVNNTDATNELNEPYDDCAFTFKTIWYSFTPAVNMTIKADAAGSSFANSQIKAYRDSGSGIGGLSFMACAASGNSATLNLQAGATYYFQVGSMSFESGDLYLNLQEVFPPANDNFGNTTVIDTLPFSDVVSNTDTTTEPNEPVNCYYSPKTVWYSFTPTTNTLVKADMAGSSFSDTILNVYQLVGSGITGLNFMQCAYYGNSATFSVQAGVTYYIQAGSINYSGGDLHLNLQEILRPANDDFGNAKVVGSLPFSDSLDPTNATTESNEPQYCYYSPNTVWYSFTPSANALVRADMAGSSFGDTIFNVYQSVGFGINGLSFQQCGYFGNSATFSVQAGVTYYIQAGSIYNSGGDLHLNLQEIPRPGNADFANATPVTSLPFSATPDITNGGIEPNEPQACYYMSDTVWYSFTPTVKTLVRANTQGSAINSNLNVYHDTGSGISGLNLVPNGCSYSYGTVTFIAEAGQTYYFQAGGIYGQVGTVQVNLEQLPLPANDDFANATLVSLPLPFDNTVDTQYSTRQTGEPTPSCAYYGPGTRSVWYAFTPATSGSFSTSIFGYAFTPVFAAYTGSSMGNLTQVGCQTSTGNLMTLHMNAGTTYYFQVGNLYYWEQGGSMQFHLDIAPQPVANFYYYPGDPSKYDTVQFYDGSNDPGNVGFQTFGWTFGDGGTSSVSSPTHKYAADGNYQVTHTVTTIDGRTATITQTVQVRTHDVAIAKITAPNSANVGQTKTISVTLRNNAYPETVQIDLYKSTANGFVWVATVTKSVPVLSGNKTTAVNFSYTFTSDDAKLGKVTFKAVATIIGARDAYPADNEMISLITKVAK